MEAAPLNTKILNFVMHTTVDRPGLPLNAISRDFGKFEAQWQAKPVNG
jgi:hypothetical protein